MNDWQKTVAKFTKLHKGKSLTEILPLAKAEYRKTHKVGKIVKKPRKTRDHKKKQRGGEVEASNADEYSLNNLLNEGGSTSPQQEGGKRRKRRTKKSRKGKKAKKSHSRRRH